MRYQIWMLQVHKNEISLRKCSGGSAQFRALEWTLVPREPGRFDNNDSETKSQVSLLKFPEENLNFIKTHIVSGVRRKFPTGDQVSSQSCDVTNQL